MIFENNKIKFAKFYLIFALAYAVIAILGGAISSAVSNKSFATFIGSLFTNSVSTGMILLIIGSVFAYFILNQRDSKITNNLLIVISTILIAYAVANLVYYVMLAMHYSVSDMSLKYIAGSLILDTLYFANAVVFVILSKYYLIIVEFVKSIFGKTKKASTNNNIPDEVVEISAPTIEVSDNSTVDATKNKEEVKATKQNKKTGVNKKS